MGGGKLKYSCKSNNMCQCSSDDDYSSFESKESRLEMVREVLMLLKRASELKREAQIKMALSHTSKDCNLNHSFTMVERALCDLALRLDFNTYPPFDDDDEDDDDLSDTCSYSSSSSSSSSDTDKKVVNNYIKIISSSDSSTSPSDDDDSSSCFSLSSDEKEVNNSSKRFLLDSSTTSDEDEDDDDDDSWDTCSVSSPPSSPLLHNHKDKLD